MAFIRIRPEIRYRHLSMVYFAAFFTIGLAALLSNLQPYIYDVFLGITDKDETGKLTGNLLAISEIVFLSVVGLWGVTSDRVGRRAVYATGMAITGCDSDSPTEPCTGPLPVEGDITPPVKISAPNPQYTDEARQARTQGVVVVQAIIDCNGLVTDIEVLQGLPNGLTEATVDAISQWTFEPARQNGRPISVFYNLSVNFRLQ